MADFFFTRRAVADLLDIEAFSLKKWGESQTEKYMNDLYRSFKRIAANPDLGKLRQDRSYPFSLAPAGQHFIVFKPTGEGIIIATILHSHLNIEGIIRSIGPHLSQEIEALLRGN